MTDSVLRLAIRSTQWARARELLGLYGLVPSNITLRHDDHTGPYVTTDIYNYGNIPADTAFAFARDLYSKIPSKDRIAWNVFP